MTQKANCRSCPRAFAMTRDGRLRNHTRGNGGGAHDLQLQARPLQLRPRHPSPGGLTTWRSSPIRAAPRTPAPRQRCPNEGKDVPIKKDGTFREHYNDYGRHPPYVGHLGLVCVMSGRPPSDWPDVQRQHGLEPRP